MLPMLILTSTTRYLETLEPYEPFELSFNVTTPAYTLNVDTNAGFEQPLRPHLSSTISTTGNNA